MRVDGMRMLVTGAAGGIGAAIADGFVDAGHEAFRHDLVGGAGIDVVGDILDPRTLEAVAAFVADRSIDCVVAAHGIIRSGALRETDAATVDLVMRVNTLAVIELHDAVAGSLNDREGAFLAVSSQAGLLGEPQNGIYSASKAALIGWAQAIAADPATRHRLRVLCPGMTETPLLIAAFRGVGEATGVGYDAVVAERLAGVPAGRLARPAEIARGARWLAEYRGSAYQLLSVNGGEVLA